VTIATFVVATLLLAAPGPQAIRLAVPIVEQTPERCGPAALGMVLGFYDAPDSALARAAATYDPILRGALITEIARAATRSGYEARIAQADAADLREALAAGTPPIVLYDVGFGPLNKHHFGVVVGWDPRRKRFTLHDGRAKPREMKESSLMSRCRGAGSLALFVEAPE
jgi:ABC-type bacteriocin/lantibiotic exporter with double-glycine peptidase domain